LRVPRVKLEAAADILEVSPNVGDHHVPGTKLGCSVSWFKCPFRHLGISRYEILRSIPPPARNLQDRQRSSRWSSEVRPGPKIRRSQSAANQPLRQNSPPTFCQAR